MSSKRVYVVTNGAETRLIRAASTIQARNHVAKESILVKVASQDDLIKLIPNTTVEEAGTTEEESDAT